MSSAAIAMRRERCITGCGERGVHRHHVVYAQHLPAGTKRDPRNLVWLALECHFAHHSRMAPIALAALPDTAIEFAAETLGPGPASVYLARRYAGDDPRVD